MARQTTKGDRLPHSHLLGPGLYFTAQALVAVLHALFDHGPDFGVAAFPVSDGAVADIGQVGDSHLAGIKTADGEVAEAVEEVHPAVVGGRGLGGPGDAI